MWPSPKVAALILSAHAAGVAAQCSNIHVFGARETTVAQGYGTDGAMITLIKNQYPGTTSEAIVYPACGGGASCGGVAYGDSANEGTAAVASAVNSYHTQCPNAQLILVGYSQGGQIMDNALCGGGDSGSSISSTAVPISSGALSMIKAAIFMGDPRYVAGLPYEVGTCTAHGFDARPSGFSCPSASLIKSYCDSQDPYCCTGNDAAHHQEYVTIYGQQALTFIEGKLSSTTGSSPPTTTKSSGGGQPTSGGGAPTGGGGSCSALYGQCGGMGWSGPSCCNSGSTCKESNPYYSQCL